MLKIVERYIAKNQLLSPEATVIVGLSGGKDSMVLLDVLTLLGYRCIAAHCNFHLRGDESDRDALFVKRWCKSVDVALETIDFDTNGYAKDKKISIEMAARELRYAWFEILRKQYEAEAIAVAHHRDDSIETVLLNLIRGTGIKGLTGISAKNGKVVRPLLCVSRKDIEAYIAEREFSFVEDSSNSDDTFVRNAIRQNVLPLLEKLNLSVRNAIWRTSQNLDEVRKIYDVSIQKSIDNLFIDNKIDIEKLKKEISPASVLFSILSPYGFTPSDIENISDSLNANSGKMFFAPKHRLIRDRNFFILDKLPETFTDDGDEFPIYENTLEISHPICLTFSETNDTRQIPKDPLILCADAEKLTFPLTLRRWKKGDWFVPFGMKGRKKLSDFFTDIKLNIREKEDVWVLTSDEKIVWVVGYRPDERFKITPKTQKMLIVAFSKK